MKPVLGWVKWTDVRLVRYVAAELALGIAQWLAPTTEEKVYIVLFRMQYCQRRIGEYSPHQEGLPCK